MAAEEVKVCLASSDGRVGSGVLCVKTLGFMRRLLVALVWGVAVLLLTALSVFIPILHFVLVPLGLITTLLVALRIFATPKIILSGEGICGACSGKIHIRKRRFGLPFDDVCENCHRAVTIKSEKCGS